MKDLRELVMLSSLVMPAMVGIDLDSAYGENPKIRIQTDNGSAFVDVTIEKGTATGNTFAIDSPQEVKFDMVFLTRGLDHVTHVNYIFDIADGSGSTMVHRTGLHVHDGMDTQSVTFSDTGSFTLTFDIAGTGLSQPYDTAQSGTASVMIAVTPEFPLGVVALMAALVGIGVAATRFKNSLKL